MSSSKARIRIAFRTDVFERDSNRCRINRSHDEPYDAHHIIDRNEIVDGGYVVENGITLCARCHVLAEVEHDTGVAAPGYGASELFALIGSSREKAHAAAKRVAARRR